ncbi:MAG: hypothetical protein ACI4W6_10790 [Acutalibacteraceae bacterium]
MRLKLNLNKYYEGLEDYQIGMLFGLFVSAKPNIDRTKQLILEGKKVSNTLALVIKSNTLRSFSEIDEFMKSSGKDPIFDLERLKKEAGGNLKDVDELPLVKKYYFLMEEPEKSKK